MSFCWCGGDKELHIDALIERSKQLLGDNRYRFVFELALNTILDDIRDDLGLFGVDYQDWFSEKSLVESGAVNKAIEKLLNVKAENMLGKGNYEHALPFYGERRPVLIDLVRNWQPEYEEKYLSVKKEGENLISESYHEHLGDGGIYLSATAGLLYDAAGKITGAIETLRDSTEQKHMERDLRRNLEELERFNKLAIGREIKMIRLKEEINELLCQLNQDKKYKIVK